VLPATPHSRSLGAHRREASSHADASAPPSPSTCREQSCLGPLLAIVLHRYGSQLIHVAPSHLVCITSSYQQSAPHSDIAKWPTRKQEHSPLDLCRYWCIPSDSVLDTEGCASMAAKNDMSYRRRALQSMSRRPGPGNPPVDHALQQRVPAQPVSPVHPARHLTVPKPSVVVFVCRTESLGGRDCSQRPMGRRPTRALPHPSVRCLGDAGPPDHPYRQRNQTDTSSSSPLRRRRALGSARPRQRRSPGGPTSGGHKQQTTCQFLTASPAAKSCMMRGDLGSVRTALVTAGPLESPLC
jgi:hypothetical protein